jgi:hypothetical protein
MKVLQVLMQKPRGTVSGADIARDTKLLSGTVYPILLRLERAGWLSSEWETLDPIEAGRPRKRFYTLTGVGYNKAGGSRMAIVTALAISLIASIIAIELYFALPKASEWLLRIATRRLSGPMRERCFEEWKAQLADINSPLLRMIHAASLIARAKTVLHEDIDGYFRDLDADLDGLQVELKRAAKLRFDNIVKMRTACNRMRIRFILARFAVLAALLSVRGNVLARLLALPIIWGKVNPMQKKLREFEKTVLNAYKLLAVKDGQIKTAMRAVRAERRRAAAAGARLDGYDTKIPAIAAALQEKLSSAAIKARMPDEAAVQIMEAIKAGITGFQKAKPNVEEIRKLPF